ncbi:MAG: hypothetical protein ACI8TP_003168 [Acidimicrobiales bacterium]
MASSCWLTTVATAEHGPQLSQARLVESEPCPFASLLAVKDAGLHQLCEVMTDCRLALPKRLGEVAGAGFAVWGRSDDIHEAESNRVSQRFENAGELLSIACLDRATE